MDAAPDPISEAKAVANKFLEVFNARDTQSNRDVLNYPSVMLVAGQFIKWDRPEDYSIPWDRLTESQGWHHSTMDSIDVVQAGDDKVHLAVTFSRYHEDGVKYATHHGLWVITCVDGHWGIQCRSNFRP